MDRASKLRFVTFLTLIRFPLVLVFFVGAILHQYHPQDWLFLLSFEVLVISAVTDLFDGYFARRFKVETAFGEHVDPLVDKFFYVAALPILIFVAARNGHAVHGVILATLTLFLLTRDLWVTFLRSIGSMYDVRGTPSKWGKFRSFTNFSLMCTIYHYEESGTGLLATGFIYSFEAFAFIINLISLWLYTKRYMPYLRRAMSLQARAPEVTSGVG